jgi:hypothetical protein
MQISNLDAIISEEEVPVCPICEQPIYTNEPLMIGRVNNVLCLIHYYCGDIEFYDA